MNLTHLSEEDIKTVVDSIFAETQTFHSVEEAYQLLTKIIYDHCIAQSVDSDIVLSRVYHSIDYPLLPASLQKTAKQIWKDKLEEHSKLLVLMGTYGREPAWQDKANSQNHKVILLTHETLKSIPMVSRLIQQIGFDLGVLLKKDEPSASYEGISGTFGVFYVSPALGSPYIPAQDFVTQYGVQSVIGTGVMLPQGDISAYIGFSGVPVENKIAANIAPLMSLFWQKAYPIFERYGMFSSYK